MVPVLIKFNLLPSAYVWIQSQAPVKQFSALSLASLIAIVSGADTAFAFRGAAKMAKGPGSAIGPAVVNNPAFAGLLSMTALTFGFGANTSSLSEIAANLAVAPGNPKIEPVAKLSVVLPASAPSPRRVGSQSPSVVGIPLASVRISVQNGSAEFRHAADESQPEAFASLEALQALDESIERIGDNASLGVVFDASRALKAASFTESVSVDATERMRVTHFLKRLGFRSFSAGAAARLENPDLTEGQRKVFALTSERYRVFDAAREIAATAMEGLEKQGYSEDAWRKASALAAALTELRPMEPPSRLPLPVQNGSLREKREWLAGLTSRRIAYQAERVTADIVSAVYSEKEWDTRRNSTIHERRRALRDEVRTIRNNVETALVSLYTDVEGGGGRFVGRALAAAMVRQARLEDRPEREIQLATAMEARGFHLTDMVGDSFVLKDRRGREREFTIKTGDVLGTRSRSRRSSEIAYGARPHWSRWWRGWREGIFGNIIGVFLKPLEKHAVQKPGQSVRNWGRKKIHRLRKELANMSPFLKSYSHVGIADVREVDGVRMAWVWENEVDSGDGGIRLVSLWDQFLVKDYHARFGYARLDAKRTLAEYKAQSENGFQPFPVRTSDGSWKSAMAPQEQARWANASEDEADSFVEMLHRRAVTTIEGLMMAFGLGYGWGMGDTIFKTVCSATIHLGYKLGAQFEIQTNPDMWHPLTVLFAKLGLPAAASQNLKARVFWPASFFVDNKVGDHFRVDLSGRDAGKIADDWQTIPETIESSSKRMRETRAVLAAEDDEAFPVRNRLVGNALKRSLVTHRWREGDIHGGRGGLSFTRGWFRGIMRLYR